MIEQNERIKGLEVEMKLLKKDFYEHERQHKEQTNKSSDRNWALWMVLIVTAISSVAAFIKDLV